MSASKQELLKDTNGECSLNLDKYTPVIEVVSPGADMSEADGSVGRCCSC